MIKKSSLTNYQLFITKISTQFLVRIYFIFLASFAIYTYSQIDLNLTLWSNPIYQRVQQILIQLGYFHRPLSTVIFIASLVIFFIFYCLFLIFIKEKKILSGTLWRIIFLSYLILTFSYPAFSHDIFNYLFDARIVTKYGLSPHYFTALDFPDDPWTRFMHWTHRYYPYGPLWLSLTLPFSFLGLGKFVLTLGLFKLFFAVIALSNVWLIGKILGLISPKAKLFGMAFFGLNPLVMIESVVSPHNEATMFFFTLCGILLLILKKRLLGAINLLASTAVKFLPIIYLPLAVLSSSRLLNSRFYTLLTVVTVLALVPVIYFRQPYPWYLIPVIGLISISQARWLIILTIGLSIGTLLRYAPYLYFGDYNPPVPQIQNWLLALPILVSIGFILIKASRRTIFTV